MYYILQIIFFIMGLFLILHTVLLMEGISIFILLSAIVFLVAAFVMHRLYILKEKQYESHDFDITGQVKQHDDEEDGES